LAKSPSMLRTRPGKARHMETFAGMQSATIRVIDLADL